MAIYKTRWFDRWARKQNLSTRTLCKAVREMRAGLYAGWRPAEEAHWPPWTR